jgi:uncharacterized membrane protein YkvA (DUF1232 family)
MSEGLGEKSIMSMNKERRFGTYYGLLRFIPLIPYLPKVIRLGWRLFRDRRVPFYLKAMVVAALLYVLSPFDFISEIVFPGLGYLDDATLLLLAGYFFMRWSPQEVVAEHVTALGENFRRRFQRWRSHFPSSR